MGSDLNAKSKGLWGWNIVIIILVTQLLFYLGIVLFYGFIEEYWRINVRLSARLAVLLFCLAFMASALHFLFKNSWTYWLRFNRKYFGISFAFTHLLHLLFLIVLQYTFHPVFELAKTTSLLGGGLAYVFLVAMLFTSFPKFENLLSKRNWTLLHTIGGYWIWFIFLRTYFKKVATGHHEFWPYVFLLTTVLVLKTLQKLKISRANNI